MSRFGDYPWQERFRDFQPGADVGGVTGKPAATGEILRLISRKSKACECDF